MDEILFIEQSKEQSKGDILIIRRKIRNLGGFEFTWRARIANGAVVLAVGGCTPSSEGRRIP